MLEPIDKPITANFDAMGHSVLATNAHNSWWGYVTVSGQAKDLSSNPTWLISVAGAPRLFSSGPVFSLGPILVGPTIPIKVEAFGGTLNDTWLGSIWGVGADMPEELATVSQAQSSAIFAQKSNSRIDIVTKIVTTALAGATQLIVNDASQLQLGDGVSTTRVINGVNSGGVFPFFVNAISRNADGTWTVTLSTGIFTNLEAGSLLAVIPVVSVNTGTGPLSVRNDNSPPPWQSAKFTADNNIGALAAGGTIVMIAAAGGQSIYVHHIHVEMLQAAAGAGSNVFVIRDSTVGDTAGYLLGTGSNVARVWDSDGKGAATAAGAALLLKNLDSIPHDYAWSVQYSQV